MRLFRRIFKSNKGLSLLELVVAIAFLAIVITPVMNSFITAGKINAKSRKLMCANDCAQALMEGIADKSFYELCLAYDKYGSESVSASYAMSGLNDNAYNMPTCSANTGDTNVVFKSPFNVTGATVSCNDNYKLKYYDGTNWVEIMTQPSVSDNGFVQTINEGFRKDCKAAMSTFGTGTELEKHLGIWVNSTDVSEMKLMMISYCGIEWDGYYFDAVLTFIPEGREPQVGKEPDKWYSYYVQIDIYDLKKTPSGFVRTLGLDETGADTIAPLLSLNTGIKNN